MAKLFNDSFGPFEKKWTKSIQCVMTSIDNMIIILTDMIEVKANFQETA